MIVAFLLDSKLEIMSLVNMNIPVIKWGSTEVPPLNDTLGCLSLRYRVGIDYFLQRAPGWQVPIFGTTNRDKNYLNKRGQVGMGATRPKPVLLPFLLISNGFYNETHIPNKKIVF